MGQKFLSIKNYEKYQHYKDRNPPWIKLYWDLLSDDDFVMLTLEERSLYFHMLLLSSRHQNLIPFDRQYIRLQLKLTSDPNLTSLLRSGFLIAIKKPGPNSPRTPRELPENSPRTPRELTHEHTENSHGTQRKPLNVHGHDASGALANGYHDAMPLVQRESSEKEFRVQRTEREIEKKEEGDGVRLTIAEILARWNGIAGVKPCKQAVDRLASRLNELRKSKSREWWDTFFAEVQRSKFLTGRATPTQGRPVFRADLFWATGPLNLSKLLSGKYADDDEPSYDPLREQVKFLLGAQ